MIYHTPKKLGHVDGIRAGITYAHREKYNTLSNITGLNFGSNEQASWPDVKSNFDLLNDQLSHSGKMAIAEQVHGSNIEIVDEPGFFPATDGFITSQKGLLIGVKVADCAAVLMADPESGLVAAVHAGWRGAASGIVGKAAEKLINEGATTQNIRCYISPCISMANFEVGEEVASEFSDEFNP